MKLVDYLREERGRAAQIAVCIGIAPAYLSQMSTGRRPIPPELAVSVESATARAVRRWDLRPTDWHRIWPELIGADGAPPPPESPALEESRAA